MRLPLLILIIFKVNDSLGASFETGVSSTCKTSDKVSKQINPKSHQAGYCTESLIN